MTVQRGTEAWPGTAVARRPQGELLPGPQARAGPQRISALPAIVDLDLYQGDDFTLLIDVTGPDGMPLDLAGTTPESHIRANPASSVLAGEFMTVVDGSTIILHLAGAVSAALPMPRSVWDVQITDERGAVTTLAAGMITLTPEVTR